MFSPTAALLPYAQATAAQRAQVLRSLQARLRRHFPTLPERSFTRALAEFQPDLLLTGDRLTLPALELTQLVQYLGEAPELPWLDPPLYGAWALDLAQYLLHSSELAAGAIVALTAISPTPCVPPLWALLHRLATPYPLAERIVHAHRWDLPGSPALPSGQPSGGPAPGSSALADLLHQLAPPASSAVRGHG